MSLPSLRVLMIIPALPVGGAEWAFVRLANALSARHEVTAYVPWASESSPVLLQALDPQARLVSLPLPWAWMHRLVYKLSLLFPKIALEQRLHRSVLGLLHRLERFQIVNAHLHSGARLACDAFRETCLPLVESDHGDYALLQKEDPSFARHRAVFARIDGLICPSHANLQRVRQMPWKPGVCQTVIPNAAAAGTGARVPPPDKQEFTFGLLARGVADKGWAEAVQAFRLLRQRVEAPLRLLLIGAGPEIVRLRSLVQPGEGIEFAGYQAEPASWISRCHVGLLPSFFTAESLPNVIVEFQEQGRPVIATDVGGIADMLEEAGLPCGLLIPLDPATGRADIQALVAAMLRMVQDSSFRARCADAALMAFQRYQPARVAEACTAFFEQVLQARSRADSKQEGGHDA